METINVAVIEDSKSINMGLCKAIEMQVMMELSFSAVSVEEGLKFMEEGKQADVLLLDIGLPGISGIEGIPKLKSLNKDLNIIMLSTYEETEKIFSALCAGACSYLSKRTSLKVIMESVHTVARGGSFMSPSIARKIANIFQDQASPQNPIKEKLTDRQYEIVEKLSEGMSYSIIAEDLSVSLNTVRHHIKRIYEILEINSKSQLFKLLNKK